jgi:hypothetical protein
MDNLEFEGSAAPEPSTLAFITAGVLLMGMGRLRHRVRRSRG